jgi:polyisoprenoid-binding protein YceI
MTGIFHGIQAFGIGLLTTLVFSGVVGAETYKIDASHSSVGFSIKHIFSKVPGNFRKFSGKIVYDPANPAGASVNATIITASIDTDNDRRDGHLKSPDFFHVADYPEASFKSNSVKKDGDRLLVSGDLTIRGVTKSVVMPVEVLGVGIHPMSKAGVAGFSGAITIKRSDYGVNHWVDEVPGLLGEDVTLTLNVEAAAVGKMNPCNPCAVNPCAKNPCEKNACNPCAKNACNPCGK